ncbi:hypothetical protein NCC49_005703 [Naganishia albida]|nr:hypothetical protein NCC49_005703 [Naganishia albida]
MVYRSEDWMQLAIEQSDEGPGTDATVNIVLDFLKVASDSPLREHYGSELYLYCKVAMMDPFDRILEEKRPFRLDLQMDPELEKPDDLQRLQSVSSADSDLVGTPGVHAGGVDFTPNERPLTGG